MNIKTALISIAAFLAPISLAQAQEVQPTDESKPPSRTAGGTVVEPASPSANQPSPGGFGVSPGAEGANAAANLNQNEPTVRKPRATTTRPSSGVNSANSAQNPRVGRTRSALPSSNYGNSTADSAANELAAGMLEEEGDLDLNSAMASYQSVIRRFDSQRQGAATAVFRLGECYRKLGQIEEAKACYARILREFPDQAELVLQSQEHLFDSRAGRTASTPSPVFQQRLQSIVSRAPSTRGVSGDPYSGYGSATMPPSSGTSSASPMRPGQSGASAGFGADPYGAGAVGGLGGSGASGGGGGFGGSGIGGGGIGGTLGGGTFGGAGLGGGLGGGIGSFPGAGSGMGGMAGMGMRSSTAPMTDNPPATPGYGGYGRRQSVPAQTELEKELARARAKAADFKRQLNDLRHQIQIIESAKPETLPESIVSDRRYRQLKDQYELAILNESNDDPQSLKAVENARKKLNTWVEKIFLPEQRAALEMATYNHRFSQDEADQLETKAKEEATKQTADPAGEPRVKPAVPGQPPSNQPASPSTPTPTLQ